MLILNSATRGCVQDFKILWPFIFWNILRTSSTWTNFASGHKVFFPFPPPPDISILLPIFVSIAHTESFGHGGHPAWGCLHQSHKVLLHSSWVLVNSRRTSLSLIRGKKEVAACFVVRGKLDQYTKNTCPALFFFKRWWNFIKHLFEIIIDWIQLPEITWWPCVRLNSAKSGAFMVTNFCVNLIGSGNTQSCSEALLWVCLCIFREI